MFWGNPWHYRFHLLMNSGRAYTTPWRSITDEHINDTEDEKRLSSRQRAWRNAWNEGASYDNMWVELPDGSEFGRRGRVPASLVELLRLELQEGKLPDTQGVTGTPGNTAANEADQRRAEAQRRRAEEDQTDQRRREHQAATAQQQQDQITFVMSMASDLVRHCVATGHSPDVTIRLTHNGEPYYEGLLGRKLVEPHRVVDEHHGWAIITSPFNRSGSEIGIEIHGTTGIILATDGRLLWYEFDFRAKESAHKIFEYSLNASPLSYSHVRQAPVGEVDLSKIQNRQTSQWPNYIQNHNGISMDQLINGLADLANRCNLPKRG